MKKNLFLLFLLTTFSTQLFSFRAVRTLFNKAKPAVSFLHNGSIFKANPAPKRMNLLGEWIANSKVENPASYAAAAKVLEIASSQEPLKVEDQLYLEYLFGGYNVDVNTIVTSDKGIISTFAGFAMFFQHPELLDLLLANGAHAYIKDNPTSFAALALETQISKLLAVLIKHNARLYPREMQEDRYKYYKAQYPSFFVIDQK